MDSVSCTYVLNVMFFFFFLCGWVFFTKLENLLGWKKLEHEMLNPKP